MLACAVSDFALLHEADQTVRKGFVLGVKLLMSAYVKAGSWFLYLLIHGVCFSHALCHL